MKSQDRIPGEKMLIEAQLLALIRFKIGPQSVTYPSQFKILATPLPICNTSFEFIASELGLKLSQVSDYDFNFKSFCK